MTEQVRVNIAHKDATVKHETRNGREVIVVRSATLPDNIVMNGIKYPAEEIANSFKSLENTPAPLGHPVVNGEFVSAKHPVGLNIGYFGAYNENVRQDNGRVIVDKVIDVERASESKLGQRVLNAIKDGKPIHTSTGLLCLLRNSQDDSAEYEAYAMEFDHDAILLDEPGAATPEQGVGMMVNGKRMEVINSSIEEDFDQEIEWAAQSVMRAIERREERKEDNPAVSRIKSAILKALGLSGEQVTKSNEVSKMTDVTKEQFDELSAKVDKLAAVNVETVVNEALKPLIDAQSAQAEAVKVANEAKKTELVNKLAEKGVLPKEVAEKMDLDALEALGNMHKSAAAATGGYTANDGAEDFGFKSGWEDK